MSLFNLLFGKKEQPVENNPTSAEPLAEPTNADDDLANTRFLNWYVKGKHSSFPKWMHYECKIDDPRSKEEQMICRGLLQHSGTIKGVTDCVLTDAGNDFIKEHAELLTAIEYQRYGITVDEYISEKRNLGDTVPDEVAKAILNRRLNDTLQEQQYCAYRNVLLSLAELSKSSRNYEESLQYYLYTLRIDLSGLEDGGNLASYQLIIAPAVKKAIYEYKDYYAPKMLNNCQKLEIPDSIVSFTTFKKIVADILAGNNTLVTDFVSQRTMKKYDNVPSEEELDREIANLGKEI